MSEFRRDKFSRHLLSVFALSMFFFAGTISAQAPASSAPSAAFSVPQWTSLRIRMDDTLTTKYSIVGDPFSATVLDRGIYQGARVYGTIQDIDNSGKFRGHTTVILAFNRLVMPDGRRAPISAEIVKLYHAPSGESVDVEGAIESSGRGKKIFRSYRTWCGRRSTARRNFWWWGRRRARRRHRWNWRARHNGLHRSAGDRPQPWARDADPHHRSRLLSESIAFQSRILYG